MQGRHARVVLTRARGIAEENGLGRQHAASLKDACTAIASDPEVQHSIARTKAYQELLAPFQAQGIVGVAEGPELHEALPHFCPSCQKLEGSETSHGHATDAHVVEAVPPEETQNSVGASRSAPSFSSAAFALVVTQFSSILVTGSRIARLLPQFSTCI